MKTLQTKPWLKAIAGVLCVVSLTTAVVSLGSVQWLTAREGYQDNGYNLLMDSVEHDLVTDLTYQVYEIYASQENQPGYQPNIDTLLAEPNFFYTIKDQTGKTLSASEELGDYRARYSETFSISTYVEGNHEETVTITGFLRSDLRNVGNSYVYRELCRAATLWADRNLYLAALTAGACLGALSLVYLTWSAGRRKDTDEIALGWLDRAVPTDLLLVAGVGLGVVDLCLRDQVFYLTTSRLLYTPMLAAGIALLLVWYLSLVRRLKAKVLGDNLFLWKLGKPGRWVVKQCRRAGRAIRRGGSTFMAKLPLFWTAGLDFLALCFLEVLSIWIMARGDFVIGVLFWLLVKGIAAATVIYVVLSMRELQQGGRQLAAGNLDYKVPLDNLRWDFKAHGEHLNSMRTAIQAAVEDQMKSERMKTELITNVSHDIKTPLTSIVNYVDLLKKQEMPTDEAKEYLEVLDRQAGKLKKLTEDLVEAAKASTGNMTVNFQRTDVNVLLTQSSGEYQEKLQSKNLQLLLTPAQDNPAISADGRLLWRVFENLLSNIYKYALPGTRVYLTCQATETQVTITFRNISANPLNISADELMERFVRGDDSRHTEGSGLGLSIAKSLTQLQNGTFDLAIDGDLFKAILTFPRLS